MSQKFVLLNSCTIIFDQNFMKLLEDVYFQFLLSTCIQNFSNWHALFVFLSHSVAVAVLIGISSGAQDPAQPPNKIC